MGSEGKGKQQSSIPRLSLFSVQAMQLQSPERSGMLTPPLHTSASVPFRWEQEPGKPRLCNALVAFSNPTDKCLELPPRLLLPSPAALLQGPYVGSNRFRSPSFKMGSSYNCYGSSSSTDKGLLGAMVLIKGGAIKDDGWFGSWRKKAFKFKVKREVTGGSHVFPSSTDRDTATITDTHNMMVKRSGSSSSLSHGKSRVWTSIREGVKQVVPWRSKKLKKDGSSIRL